MYTSRIQICMHAQAANAKSRAEILQALAADIYVQPSLHFLAADAICTPRLQKATPSWQIYALPAGMDTQAVDMHVEAANVHTSRLQK